MGRPSAINTTQIEFLRAVLPWFQWYPYAKTVGDFSDWFTATYPSVTLNLVDWKGDPIASPDPAWYLGDGSGLSVSPTWDCPTAFPPDSLTAKIYPRQVHGFTGLPSEWSPVPCEGDDCDYSLTWDYEGGTDKDATGTWGWADNLGTASYPTIYNGGWTGTYFGWNGLSDDELAGSGTGAGHLPVTAGQTVELSLLFNNRSSSQTSTYTIKWFTSVSAVTSFATEPILVCGAHGNSWMTYSDSVVAPAGAGGFSILMPRQCGQDDVTVCVSG